MVEGVYRVRFGCFENVLSVVGIGFDLYVVCVF